jgi:hypothetical protein
MGMGDGGYNPGQLDFTQRSEPVVRMASGGIVALAEGGGLALPEGWGVAGGKYDDPSEKISYFNQQNVTPEQLLAANQGVTQTDIDWMLKNGYAGDTIAPGSNKYVQNVNDYFTSNPNATYQDVQNKITEYGLNPADVQAAMTNSGLSGAAQYAAFNQNIGDTGNVSETYGGLKGLSSNINYWLDTHPGASFNDAQNEMKKWDISEDDIRRATGKTLAELFTGPITTVYNPAEGVSGGGNTVVNPNGTVTTTPDIPGRPADGFTGMADVRNAYTGGGGSLGYIPYAPKTIEEFNTKYVDRLTGGSKQAYDYLTGKTKYSATPYTETGEIQKPYWESVGRFPAQEKNKNKKYVYVNGKYELNPDYVKPSYVLAGEKAAALTNQDKEPTDSPGAGNKWTWNSADKKWEAKPIADTTANSTVVEQAKEGGLMAMAGGGMSSQYNLGSYSDGGRLLRGPGDGVSDSIPATIGNKRPARLADGEFVVPARIVSELGNGSTEAGARKLYAMMERVQAARRGTVGKKKVAKNSRADKYLPA